MIADWLLRLTTAHKRWGFGLCFLHLRNVKGFPWNHKRVYRIYRELELNLRIKPKHRLRRDKPDVLSVSTAMNQVRKSPPHKFFFTYLSFRFAALLGFTGGCYSAFVLQPTRPLR